MNIRPAADGKLKVVKGALRERLNADRIFVSEHKTNMSDSVLTCHDMKDTDSVAKHLFSQVRELELALESENRGAEGEPEFVFVDRSVTGDWFKVIEWLVARVSAFSRTKSLY